MARFWHDIEQRFGELQVNCGDLLQATWMESGSGKNDYRWRLAGSSESARKMFIWLADRAAVELGHQAGTGWSYWLDLLKRDSPNHRDMRLQGFDSDGAGVKTEAGTILQLCGASAQYCIYCEGFMISKHRRSSEAQMIPVAGVRSSALVLRVRLDRKQAEAQDSSADSRLGILPDPGQARETGVEDRGPDVRSEMVDAFLLQCNSETLGFKVRRKHIWLAVGHARSRQFHYWQVRSAKATHADDRNFRRILRMLPAEFIALLTKKGISLSTS